MHKLPSNPRFVNLAGLSFNRWTVIAYAGQRGHHHLWKCRCSCGTKAIIFGGNLTRNLSRSCGCYDSEVTAARNRANATHGGCGTPEYDAWHAIIQRCCNPRSRCYGSYGGRGIAVCDRWRKSFADFLTDMGPRTSPAHSIDRIDNNRGYEPGNCRWAIQTVQDRNKRTTRLLTFNGETLCATEWADRLGINRQTLFTRLRKGWSVEKTLTYHRSLTTS